VRRRLGVRRRLVVQGRGDVTLTSIAVVMVGSWFAPSLG
jgi:hypothetical protein